MKIKEEKAKLKALTKEQLQECVVDYRTSLFKLRLAKTTGHVKDYSQFKKLRAGLARTLTYLHQLG